VQEDAATNDPFGGTLDAGEPADQPPQEGSDPFGVLPSDTTPPATGSSATDPGPGTGADLGQPQPGASPPAAAVFNRLGQLLGQALNGGMGQGSVSRRASASQGEGPFGSGGVPAGDEASAAAPGNPFGSPPPQPAAGPFGGGEDPFGASEPADQGANPFGNGDAAGTDETSPPGTLEEAAGTDPFGSAGENPFN
jgi:hypothetical protein